MRELKKNTAKAFLKVIDDFYETDLDSLRAAYKYVKNEHLESEGIRFFFKHKSASGTAVNPDSKQDIDVMNSYYSKYQKMLSGLIDRFSSVGYTEDEFYKRLWNIIEEDGFVDSSEEDKLYAWFLVWRNNRIPYFNLEQGISMSNEAYSDIYNKLSLAIAKANYILNTRFEQKTQQSSLLVRLLDTCENEEQKSVVMSAILVMKGESTLDERGAELLQKILP